MGGASSWYAMLFIALFLGSVWCSGKVAKMVGMSSIIFEVAVGIVLGPQVLGLLPKELSLSVFDQTMNCDERGGYDQMKIAKEGYHYCDLDAYVTAEKYEGIFGEVGSESYNEFHHEYFNHRRLAGGSAQGQTDYESYEQCLEQQCALKKAISTATIPDIFTLTGHIGVALMIFESGMHFDFQQAKTVGPWASLVAIGGTFLPLLSGTGLAMAFGFPMFPDAMCAGVALAPTSVGIALKLLHEAGALSQYFGQAVMTAAFVDDVLSLVIFSVLFTAAAGEISFMAFLPLICGCVFMALAIPAAVTVWPKFLSWLFSVVPETKPHAKLTRHHEVMFIVMFVTLCVYGLITHLCGTHLWGCFIAGMSFAPCHEAHHVWVRQVKRNTCWFLRIFFASTLAWSIPVEALFSVDALWKGTLMGLGPCIATKVLCGPFMGSSRWVIGWAMVGRAEFAYFIAIFAKSLMLMDDNLFAILVWALLYATIFAPIIFRKVLDRYMAANCAGDVEGGKKPHLHHSSTGHLPDLIAEQMEQEELELREKAAKFDETLKEKDEEIARLNALLENSAEKAAYPRILGKVAPQQSGDKTDDSFDKVVASDNDAKKTAGEVQEV